MKKIMAVVALAAIISAGAFAKSSKKDSGIELAVGGAYGLGINTRDTGNDNSEASTTNNLGFKADVTFDFNKDVGIQLDSAFLFPIGKRTVKVKTGDHTDSDDVDIDKGFCMNFLVGPVFNIKINDDMKLRLGVGFDMLMNSLTDVSKNDLLKKTVTSQVDIWNFGVGCTADYILNFKDNMGLKFGLTAAIAGGKSANWKTTTEVSSKTTTDSGTNDDYDNFTFIMIPDVSFVIKF